MEIQNNSNISNMVANSISKLNLNTATKAFEAARNNTEPKETQVQNFKEEDMKFAQSKKQDTNIDVKDIQKYANMLGEDLTIDDLIEGNLDEHNCSSNKVNSPEPIYCTFDGELKQGAEYVNGQYTYRYMQAGKYSSELAWQNITKDGWGVQLTDRTSTDHVTSKVCTYINNKPVVSMSYMFGWSKTKAIDLASFNTSNVTDMAGMFESSQVTTLDLSNFDTSNVTKMSGMFYYSKATALDVSNFDTSNVTDMNFMFKNSKAKYLDLSNFDTSNVTNMGNMFSESQATIIDGLKNFNTSKVHNMESMFQNAQATTLDVSSFDTSKVTNMLWMFADSKVTTLDLSNFDTSSVWNMRQMFAGIDVDKLDLSSFNTSKVQNMEGMFAGVKATTLDLSSFDTSKVTDMSSMFYHIQTTTLDLGSFDTSNVSNMGWMFQNADNLETIYVSNKFVTKNVTGDIPMFKNSPKLVGGAGTVYDSTKVDKTYARIDGGTSSPGYFTKK